MPTRGGIGDFVQREAADVVVDVGPRLEESESDDVVLVVGFGPVGARRVLGE